MVVATKVAARPVPFVKFHARTGQLPYLEVQRQRCNAVALAVLAQLLSQRMAGHHGGNLVGNHRDRLVAVGNSGRQVSGLRRDCGLQFGNVGPVAPGA